MPATDEQLSAENLTFRLACREDTGTALCDSGGANGRGWQQPEIPADSPMTHMEFWGWNEDGTPENEWPEIMGYLHTGAFLDENVEIDRELQARFIEFAFAEERKTEAWEDCLEAFFETEMPGWTVERQGNVYNEENDFSCVWTWTVLLRDEGDGHGDWIFADEGDFIVIYRMHTGADVRGGYGRPIFSTTGCGEYVMPLEQVCDWYFEAIPKPENETPIMPGMPEEPDLSADWAERANQSGEFSPGYSNYPIGEVGKFIRRCWPETYKGPGTGVVVEVAYVPDGEYSFSPGDGSADEVRAKVILHCEAPYCGC